MNVHIKAIQALKNTQHNRYMKVFFQLHRPQREINGNFPEQRLL